MDYQRNPFESRDLTTPTTGIDQKIDSNSDSKSAGKSEYGERRSRNRRKAPDRRNEIRFETDKKCRRKSQGRRSQDGVDITF